VDGRFVLKGGRAVTVDEQKVMESAAAEAEALLARSAR
jgi:hypothetical protein